MAWTAEYQANLYLEYILTGCISGREVKEAAVKGIEMAKEYDTILHLIDAKEAQTDGDVSLLINLFELASKVYFYKKINPKSRMAVVTPKSPEASEAARFYETASINRGWQVQCFETHDEAVAWLQNP